jgi:hypothetical protein
MISEIRYLAICVHAPQQRQQLFAEPAWLEVVREAANVGV